MHREIKEINRCIKKYAHQTIKAQKLNTTDNEHYRLRIRTLRYVKNPFSGNGCGPDR